MLTPCILELTKISGCTAFVFRAHAVALGLHSLILFSTLRTERSSLNIVLLESQGHTHLLSLL